MPPANDGQRRGFHPIVFALVIFFCLWSDGSECMHVCANALFLCCSSFQSCPSDMPKSLRTPGLAGPPQKIRIFQTKRNFKMKSQRHMREKYQGSQGTCNTNKNSPSQQSHQMWAGGGEDSPLEKKKSEKKKKKKKIGKIGQNWQWIFWR